MNERMYKGKLTRTELYDYIQCRVENCLYRYNMDRGIVERCAVEIMEITCGRDEVIGNIYENEELIK